ncbi:MAG: NUDIX domain-containing protein [Acidobacteriota bacterium]
MELPEWLYCALSRKQMRQAIARHMIKFHSRNPLLFTEHLQKLRRQRKPQSIIIRVAARAAIEAGTHFEPTDNGYYADQLSIEYISCNKLPGRYEKLQRIDGAGGIVLRAKQEQEILLLLKREGDNMEWVLPKGRRKTGERRRQTALREVKEETGIAALKVKKFLGRVGYFVITGKQVVYKRVSYYLMRCGDPAGSLRVRTSEGFVEGQWVSLEDALLLTNPARAHTVLDRLLNKSRRAVTLV